MSNPSATPTLLQAQVRKAVSDDEYYRNIVNQVAAPKQTASAAKQDNPREELDSFMQGRIERTHRAAQAAGDRLRFLRNKHGLPGGPEARRPDRQRR